MAKVLDGRPELEHLMDVAESHRVEWVAVKPNRIPMLQLENSFALLAIIMKDGILPSTFWREAAMRAAVS